MGSEELKNKTFEAKITRHIFDMTSSIFKL